LTGHSESPRVAHRATCGVGWGILRGFRGLRYVERLDEAGQPAVAVFNYAGLNADELFAQALGDFAEVLGGCRDFEVFCLELADGGDHCCGAASEDFGDVAVCHAFTPFGEGDCALFDGHAAVLGELNQRGAGHTFKDGAGQFGGDDLVFLAEDEAHNEIDQILLKLPKENYIPIKGDIIFDGSSDVHYVTNAPYVAFADITTLLQNSKRKEGEYTIANVRAGRGYIEGGSSAGWALVVVYEDFKEKMKKVEIKDGFLEVRNNQNPIVFNKFRTPAEQEVFPRLFGAAFESDAYLGENKIAVRTRKSGVYLETDKRKAENFFNSSITEDEEYLKGRKLNSINTMGFDVFSMEVPNFNNQFVPSESETLNVDIVSTEDVFYTFLMGLSIDSDVLTSTEEVQRVFDEEQKKLDAQNIIPETPNDLPQDKKQPQKIENSLPEEKKIENSPKNDEAKKGYYTILGAYSTKENAEKFLKNIHKKGIEAQGVFFHPTKNKYYVYFSYTPSYNDALKAQKDFSKLKMTKPELKDLKDVWILIIE